MNHNKNELNYCCSHYPRLYFKSMIVWINVKVFYNCCGSFDMLPLVMLFVWLKVGVCQNIWSLRDTAATHHRESRKRSENQAMLLVWLKVGVCVKKYAKSKGHCRNSSPWKPQAKWKLQEQSERVIMCKSMSKRNTHGCRRCIKTSVAGLCAKRNAFRTKSCPLVAIL